ncbi:MAG TPA: Rid family detoxifying hydrolase [Pyrinomonadaceae bacterium]|nr:Rid family detoxifying hydrolase [Pyrinomonadaceae bacterium]
MKIETVSTDRAPAPAGHYSQAVVCGGLVYVSGQLPIDPASGERRVGTIEEQTRQVLRNVAAVLEAAGSGLDRVLRMTVYVSDISLWAGVNAVYAEVMGDHRPARAVVPVRELHYGYQIEVEAVAAVRDAG